MPPYSAPTFFTLQEYSSFERQSRGCGISCGLRYVAQDTTHHGTPLVCGFQTSSTAGFHHVRENRVSVLCCIERLWFDWTALESFRRERSEDTRSDKQDKCIVRLSARLIGRSIDRSIDRLID